MLRQKPSPHPFSTTETVFQPNELPKSDTQVPQHSPVVDDEEDTTIIDHSVRQNVENAEDESDDEEDDFPYRDIDKREMPSLEFFINTKNELVCKVTEYYNVPQ